MINEEGSHVRGCLFVKMVSCVMEESVYGIFGGSSVVYIMWWIDERPNCIILQFSIIDKK